MNRSTDCNPKSTNVYSYARWSSDGQSDGDSGRRQDERARQWCASHGLKLTGGEQDAGVSAWKGKNRSEGSGLSRLLKIVKPGDYLLVEDNDRLSRQNWLTAMNFVAEIVAKGVTLVTLDNGNQIDAESFRRNPGCFLPAIMRAHLGNDENEKKSERIKASWQARKDRIAKGQAANLNLPNWLQWDKEADRPVLAEENAKVIRLMFAWALEGLGCQTIARRLYREGYQLVVKGKRHERILTISAPYVWRMLRNKLTIGHGIYVQPPPPGVYPAVVDESVFYAVQQQLDRNKRQTAPRTALTGSLFTGIAFCHKCGGTLCRFTQNRNGKRYQYLVCSASVHKNGGCGSRGLRYDVVEKSLLFLLSETDFVRKVIVDQKPQTPSTLESMSGKLADSQRQITKLATLIKNDPNPSSSVYEMLKVEETKAKELQQQVDAEIQRIKAETPAKALDNYEDFNEHFLCHLQRPELRQQIKLKLASFISKIICRPDERRYEVRLKGVDQGIEVYLCSKGDWLFSPSPAWALGHPIADGGNIIG